MKITSAPHYVTATPSNKTSFGNSVLIFKPGMTDDTCKKMKDFLQLNDFKIVSEQEGFADTDTLEMHYEEHKDKPMFPALIKYMQSGKIKVMEVSKPKSKDDTAELRTLVKEVMRPWFNILQKDTKQPVFTFVDKNETKEITQNGIHVSSDKFEAARELDIWDGANLSY